MRTFVLALAVAGCGDKLLGALPGAGGRDRVGSCRAAQEECLSLVDRVHDDSDARSAKCEARLSEVCKSQMACGTALDECRSTEDAESRKELEAIASCRREADDTCRTTGDLPADEQTASDCVKKLRICVAQDMEQQQQLEDELSVCRGKLVDLCKGDDANACTAAIANCESWRKTVSGGIREAAANCKNGSTFTCNMPPAETADAGP